MERYFHDGAHEGSDLMLLGFTIRLFAFVGTTVLAALAAAMIGALLGATGVCPTMPGFLVAPYLALQFVVPPMVGGYVALFLIGRDRQFSPPHASVTPATSDQDSDVSRS